MFRLSSALFLVAFSCALVVGAMYQKTAPVIEQQKQLLLEQSLQSVLKAQRYAKQEEPVVHYIAYDETGAVIGWCLPVSTKGYGGNIQLLVGVDTDEKITGINMLEHKETPGLGSKINDVEPNRNEPEFLRQFKEKKTGDLVLVKVKTQGQIQAITGATISSQAVTDGVKKAVEAFLRNGTPR